MFSGSVDFVRPVVALAPSGVAGARDRSLAAMTSLCSDISVVEVGAIVFGPSAGAKLGADIVRLELLGGERKVGWT